MPPGIHEHDKRTFLDCGCITVADNFIITDCPVSMQFWNDIQDRIDARDPTWILLVNERRAHANLPPQGIPPWFTEEDVAKINEARMNDAQRDYRVKEAKREAPLLRASIKIIDNALIQADMMPRLTALIEDLTRLRENYVNDLVHEEFIIKNKGPMTA